MTSSVCWTVFSQSSAGGVGKVDHALEELGAPAAAFRAVVGLDLNARNGGPLPFSANRAVATSGCLSSQGRLPQVEGHFTALLADLHATTF